VSANTGVHVNRNAMNKDFVIIGVADTRSLAESLDEFHPCKFSLARRPADTLHADPSPLALALTLTLP
jgi:hypothetical protein